MIFLSCNMIFINFYNYRRHWTKYYLLNLGGFTCFFPLNLVLKLLIHIYSIDISYTIYVFTDYKFNSYIIPLVVNYAHKISTFYKMYDLNSITSWTMLL